MIFSVQRFLEDYFAAKSLRDPDQYAVTLANLYDRERRVKSDKLFLHTVHRIRTIFYRNNHELDRERFEKSLILLLDSRFKKKEKKQIESFPGGLSEERKQLEKNVRRTMAALLNGFKRAVEARAIDSFWVSRKARKLQNRPESIGQALLAVFARGVISDTGLVLREIPSGTGYVDLMLMLSRTPHLIEMKIMKSRYQGASQLSAYMEIESRSVGWLVLFDARHQNRRSERISESVRVKHGIIHNVVIEINPVAPSRTGA